MMVTLLSIISALCLLVALAVSWGYVRQARLGRLAERNGGLDVDIDAVRGKPYTFRLFGKIHVVHPMNVEQFMEVTSAVAHMGLMASKTNSEEELLDAYSKLFRKACPTVTPEIVKSMTQAQVSQLYNAILEILAGKAHLEAEKKKKQSGHSIRLARA